MIPRILLVALASLTLAQPAHAKWRVAESDRFVVYSESRADDLADFTEMLERFHGAMELETGRKVPVPSPSSRVTVYMVGSSADLRELYGDRHASVAGFYMPRASGSVAFVPNIRITGGADYSQGTFSRVSKGANAPSFSQAILLHEYAHHFLIASSRFGMPRWLSEGAAEYFASARFLPNGAVQIGMPNNHRAHELANASEVSIYELLDADLYKKRKSSRYDAFYGRSWLLFHFLAFNEDRKGQLREYWSAVQQGTASLDAAREIFGDLDALEKELDDYNRGRRLPAMQWAANDIAVGKIAVRELSRGMDAMMPVVLRSKRGVDEEEAVELLADARAIAARYPGDSAVLAALAEAELDAGNHAAAVAASDRALAIDPRNREALVHKGVALFRLAEKAEDRDAAYAAALEPMLALNAIENDHPLPLIYYYRSFVERQMRPPEDARAALERATILAPFDDAIAMDAAFMLASEGKVTLALYLLSPIAADPHASDRSAYAQALIDAMDRAPKDKPFDISTVARPVPTEGEQNDEEA